ncbi:uncharacterized protein FIBRA_03614 [Fibroporia radiculosa]|uniref:Uncharacterized protein n=1 Tax=Fibroporia radiculosa TaxID=599839 RepID=J4GNK6_9APHY|nr:uncharacterized protein FIBRA_03614 [Fibroporia radiculosa]CCM01555.1 predicted protein [Fibroporia radiculosa]
MRFPTSVRWHRDLAYNTTWSLLAAVERWNLRADADADADAGARTGTGMGTGAGERIETVAVTGLATGVGGVDKDVCARQMVLALAHFLDVRSADGRRRWAQDGFPRWDDVLPIARSVETRPEDGSPERGDGA